MVLQRDQFLVLRFNTAVLPWRGASSFGNDSSRLLLLAVRAWPFLSPPIRDWTALSKDDNESIRMFEELRVRGAAWLGIVAPQQAKLSQEHPILDKHFQRVCRLYQRNPQMVHLFHPAAGGTKLSIRPRKETPR